MNSAQASFILDKALAERKLTHHDVRRYTTQLQHEIATLEARIAELRSTQNENAPMPVPGKQSDLKGKSDSTQTGKTRKVTAAVKASRKLQGRYLALIRQVPARQRGKYQRIAKKEGREAAIAAMEKR